VKARPTFNVRRPGYEGRALVARRRADSIMAEVRELVSRSTFLRRAWCALAGHAMWRTGLVSRAPNGTAFAIVVCRRCGKKWADAGQEVKP
jgi:hypothetical protein